MIEMLDDARIGAALVAHAINCIDDDGCCPDCCAPCGALRDLDATGRLDDAVRPYAEQGCDLDWWAGGAVDRQWLHARWRPVGCCR
jgi:hypothetical protein